ncbi:hypothetical protein ACFO5R_12015 [Halosolutus amylolyticus]|uniref:Uncharacterized protein n=1 Tax=Halosolutus amylolyticus TaxID=2932267 RepID=A0ABD5PPU6_9EURY|nr:hypothetical protein [Halosolutus amylolyticus]
MNWRRRRVLGATIAAATFAGCLGDDGDSTDERDPDGETDDAAHGDDRDAETVIAEYDLADRTGEDPVAISVDAAGDGFDPAGFEIDPSTTVEWTWEGGEAVDAIYPIDVPAECMWDESEPTVPEGDSWDRLFWAPGDYLYGSRDADGEEFTGVFRVRASVDGDDVGSGDGDGNHTNGTEDGTSAEDHADDET